jgi:multiple sugar transport system substrate-binding protein
MGGQETVAAYVANSLSQAGLNAGGDPFINNNSTMKLMGNTFLRQIARFNPKLNFRVSHYAMRKKDDPRQTWIAGQAWAIPRGTKELDAAWEIVKTYVSWDSFVAAEEADKAVNDKLGAPYIPNLPAQPELDKRIADRYKTGIELVDKAFQFGLNLIQTTPQVLSRPRSPANAEMWDASLLAFEETLRERKPAAQALKDANDKVQKVLDEAWAGR